MRSGPSRDTDRAERSLWTRRPPALRQSPASSSWTSCCASRPTSPAAGPLRSKAYKNLHLLFEPASQGRLGARAFLCQRGETVRARNCRKTSLSYRPCRRLGHGRPRYRAPRVWQWVRAAPCAAGPSAGAELLIYAGRLGKPAWARRWGWAARVPIHEKAPSAVRPASLGSKARRPCMRGGRIRRRGRRETCGSWHAGGTSPLGRGYRRGLSRSAETSLNNYYSPVCVRLVYSPSRPCPQRAGACIVLPRAAPQSMRPREPREPDTAEDAGGQTDHLGQAL